MNILLKPRHLVSISMLALLVSTLSYGSGPDELSYRFFAHVWVDISRQVCAGVDARVQERLETSLQSSGLLELNVDTLCSGGICGKYTAKEGRLDVTLKGMQEQHRQMYERKSATEKKADCVKFTTMFEKLRGGKGKPPEHIYERFLKNLE